MKQKIEKLIKKIEKKFPQPDNKTFLTLEKAKDLIANNDDIISMIDIYGDLLLIKSTKKYK
jgi:hypothetical protein